MRKFIFTFAVVLVAASGLLYWYKLSQASVGVLNIYEGSAAVARKNNEASGASGSAVRPNDVITVGQGSRVSIILKDGSVVRLEAGSVVRVEELTYNGKKIKQALFELQTGKLWSRVGPLESGAAFEVETPSIVAAVRGTSFNTEYLDQASAVYVFKRSVSVRVKTHGDASYSVGERQFFKLSDASLIEDFRAGPVEATDQYIDGWIRFNQAEDNKLDGVVVPSPATENNLPLDQAAFEPAIPPAPSPSPSLSSGNPLPGNIFSPVSPSLPPPPPIQNSPPPPAVDRRVVTVTLETQNTSLKVGDTTLLILTATYNDGTSSRVTESAKWFQTPELGIIQNPGWFSALKAGRTTIGANFQGVGSNSVPLDIQEKQQPVILLNLTVSCVKNPPAATGTAQSQTITAQCSATAHYSDGKTSDVTNQSDWTVTGQARGSITQSGYYTANYPDGIDTVTAVFQNASAATTITLP